MRQTAYEKTAVKKKTSSTNKAKKTNRKAPTAKKAAVTRKTLAGKTKSMKKKRVQKEEGVPTEAPVVKIRGRRSGRLSGDLQGLSGVEGADSESVAELVEEGNAFEAEVISGVEAAGSDESEVRTHEVPRDDVPEEYLDED